jgi:hypothetical protein
MELELMHAMSSPKRAVSPSAQVRQLRAELEAAQAEIMALQAVQSRVRCMYVCRLLGRPVRFLAVHGNTS